MMTAARLAEIRDYLALIRPRVAPTMGGEVPSPSPVNPGTRAIAELLALLDGPVRECLAVDHALADDDGRGVIRHWNETRGEWFQRCGECDVRAERNGEVEHLPGCQWERRKALLALLTPGGEAGEVRDGD